MATRIRYTDEPVASLSGRQARLADGAPFEERLFPRHRRTCLYFHPGYQLHFIISHSFIRYDGCQSPLKERVEFSYSVRPVGGGMLLSKNSIIEGSGNGGGNPLIDVSNQP